MLFGQSMNPLHAQLNDEGQRATSQFQNNSEVTEVGAEHETGMQELEIN